MASIFISHASADDTLAGQLESWLKTNGFTDVFVDHSSLRAGDKWADALRASASACRVVICVVSDSWLASDECFGEFRAAWYMGKRIIPLFLLGELSGLSEEARDRLARVRAEDQGVDITPFLTEAGGTLDFACDEARADLIRRGLRAAGALAAVGLDPEAFDVDRARKPSPFPGLQSFGDDDADAALFYGRSREIAETLEMLRKMRASAEPNPLVILGASGAGKSSLLKAGIIPRLRREAPAWIALRAFRPGADPLLNFAEAIAKTLADFGASQAHGALKRDLMEAWEAAKAAADAARADAATADEDKQAVEAATRAALLSALNEALAAQAARLREAANRPEATILISVDQAEELARSEDASGAALSDYLRAAMRPGSPWRLAFTIRTDSFPELQSHPRFSGLEARGYDLRALPVFRFDDVVESPAKRYGVEVDPALVDALMEEAPAADALPLLAFALQRLWDQFAAAGALTHSDYRAMGGLAGLIEDAAERALAGLDPDQKDAPLPAGGARSAQVKLGEKTFVPPLADVNDEGAAIRRVAAWTEFDADAQDLLARFDRWRLVVRKGGGEDGAGDTVEVAHEALFREWSRLRDWLEPERARLEALRGLKVAALAWARHERAAPFLTHFGPRLADALALEKNPRYGPQLAEDDRAYLAACRRAERAGKRRRLALQSTAYLLGLGVVLGSLGYAFEFELRREWAKQTQIRPHVLSPEELAALEPGDSFRECAEDFGCPEMVVLPGGSYWRGSPADEPGHQRDEEPRLTVDIASVAVGRFEVTHDEWAACVAYSRQEALSASGGEAGPRVGCAPANDQGFGAGARPIINVSWEDAQGYVAWLNLMISGDAENGPYRLLTEAEWEYAARGATSAEAPHPAYSWGDDVSVICDYANVANEDTRAYYSLRWEVVDCENNYRETSPVGSFRPNPFGLYDMHGNVIEWVEDCYADSYAGAPKDGSAVTADAPGTDECSLRVLRGGSWGFTPDRLRSAYRVRNLPTLRNSAIGFRLARTVSPAG